MLFLFTEEKDSSDTECTLLGEFPPLVLVCLWGDCNSDCGVEPSVTQKELCFVLALCLRGEHLHTADHAHADTSNPQRKSCQVRGGDRCSGGSGHLPMQRAQSQFLASTHMTAHICLWLHFHRNQCSLLASLGTRHTTCTHTYVQTNIHTCKIKINTF